MKTRNQFLKPNKGSIFKKKKNCLVNQTKEINDSGPPSSVTKYRS